MMVCMTGTYGTLPFANFSITRQGVREAQMLNDYPHINAADLVNAWAYAEAYPEEIGTAIKQNEAV